MLATTAFAPAGATSGGDDIESVRATVVETYNYKINLLKGLKAETSNSQRQAIYQQGISELKSKRDHNVMETDSIDALWGLKDLAHSIYHETVSAADQVPNDPAEELARAKNKATDAVEYKINKLRQWIEGCDDPEAQRIVANGIAELESLFAKIDAAQTPEEAYALKDRAHSIYRSTIDAAENTKGDKDDPKEEEKPEEKSEEEKAAEALDRARRNTLSLIERKTAILESAAAAARLTQVADIFAAAAVEVSSLKDAANAAKTTSALKQIDQQVLDLYEAAKAEAAEVRDNYEATPEKALASYLDRIVDYVTTMVEVAAATSDHSPDTFEDLVEAKLAVKAAVDSVKDVAESGNRLDDRWRTLDRAMRDFRRALIRHYIALGQPAAIGDIQIPG